jgi:hypothetical protein
MSARYTASQLPELNLPGFRSEATVMDIVQQETDWQPVLSLSIYSPNPDNPEQLDVLTAIRTAGTRTHPGVVSTPTGRFPHAFQLPLLESRDAAEFTRFRIDEINASEKQVVASFRPQPQDMPDLDDPLSFLAHETVERKLGLGDAMHDKEGSEPLATVSLSEIVAGIGYPTDDPETGEPLLEPLLMYGAVMLIHNRDAFPDNTASYREIGWTKMEDFMDGHADKRADMLVPGIAPEDEATVCVRGLCLSTTSQVTDNPDLAGHLGAVKV